MKCSSHLSLVDLSSFCPVCSFSPRYVNHQFMVTFTVYQCNGCNRRVSGCLQQTVGESGYAISSWSASAEYSALMFTRVAKVDESTFSTLSQHLCQYPVLPDHDAMNNPSVCITSIINLNYKFWNVKHVPLYIMSKNTLGFITCYTVKLTLFSRCIDQCSEVSPVVW